MRRYWKMGCIGAWVACNAAEISTDFLYWQPHQEGLNYALPDLSTQGRLKEIHFSFSPGYRLGVGSGSAQTVWSGYLFWVRYGNTSTAHKAHARWRLQYDVVDAELRRRCRLSPTFQLEPLMSLRGARIAQHVHYRYSDLEPELFDWVVRGKNNYEGVGLRAGASGIFLFHPHWQLFAEGTGSLLYGYAHGWRLRPNIEGASGAGWRSSHWAFSLQYEWIAWLNTSDEWGDLTLQGGSASLSFSF